MIISSCLIQICLNKQGVMYRQHLDLAYPRPRSHTQNKRFCEESSRSLVCYGFFLGALFTGSKLCVHFK